MSPFIAKGGCFRWPGFLRWPGGGGGGGNIPPPMKHCTVHVQSSSHCVFGLLEAVPSLAVPSLSFPLWHSRLYLGWVIKDRYKTPQGSIVAHIASDNAII